MSWRRDEAVEAVPVRRQRAAAGSRGTPPGRRHRRGARDAAARSAPSRPSKSLRIRLSHEHHSRCRQAAPRAHRRGHDGVQEGAGRDQGRPRRRRRAHAQAGPGQGRQEGDARGRRGRRGRGEGRRRRAAPPWSRSTARPISSRASRTSAPSRRRWPQARSPAQPANLGRRSAQPGSPPGRRVEERRRALVAKIGENISVRRFAVLSVRRASGRLCARHAHRRAGGGQGRRGEPGARSGDARRGQQPEVPHRGATCRRRWWPRSATSSPSRRAREGKPPEIVAKMVEGRLRKALGEITLAGQPFVKDPDVTHREAAEGRQGGSARRSSASRSAPASRRSRTTSSPRSWRR